MDIEAVGPGNSDLVSVLASAGLPTDDLSQDGRHFFCFTANGITVAFGGYELYGDQVLLRSIVVLPDGRGKGWGSAATTMLWQRARETGASQAYLLTTNAACFFERLGFKRIGRSEAPAIILATRQASSLCPSSAALMMRSIIESPLDSVPAGAR